MDEFLLWPEALPALLAVPAFIALWAAGDRSRWRRLQQQLGPRATQLAVGASPTGHRARRALAAAALTAGLIAVLQPTWGESREELQAPGIDLMICLDVSRSMLARDVAPDRLELAKQQIEALTDRLQGDRLGLVVFAGEARLSVPLTRDARSFRELLALADPLSVSVGGTDLGRAIEAARRALIPKGDSLTDSERRRASVLLLTDGEDLEGRGREAADLCRADGITVHCVGYGSPLGSKITLDPLSGEQFLRDRDGREVVSSMDANRLQAIAEVSRGSFQAASHETDFLVDLFLNRMADSTSSAPGSHADPRSANRYQWPLLLAIALWLLELTRIRRREP